MIEYLRWIGVEIANNARVATYANAAGIKPPGLNVRDHCACDPAEFALAVEGAPYTTPAADPAPWYSADSPLSGDVAGLLVDSITGLDAAPMERQVTERTGHGAVIGRQRYRPRTIIVTGTILARSTEAAEWYLRYLSEQLTDHPCGSGRACAGHDACYYVSCPRDSPPCNAGEESPGESPEESPPGFAARLDTYARTLHQVAAFSGPEVLSRSARGTRRHTLIRVQLTMVAGDPFAYTTPVAVLADEALGECESPDGECVEWIVLGPDEECPPPCGEVDPCADDPLCDQGAPPPDLPLVSDPCVCDPLTVTRTCWDIPASALDTEGTNTPVWRLTAGATDVRGIHVTITPNPLGLDPADVDECAACTQVHLPYLPAGATWTFDAARRETTILCPPLLTSAAPASGDDGGPLTWPELACAMDYVVCVEVSCESWDEGITFSLDMVGRQT